MAKEDLTAKAQKLQQEKKWPELVQFLKPLVSGTEVNENFILLLAEAYQHQNDAENLSALIKNSVPLLLKLSKAKTSKMVKQLLGFMASIHGSAQLQIELVKSLIKTAKDENRIYLRQTLETRLISLLLDVRNYSEALAMINELTRELKKLDDKMGLIEVLLLESRCYHALRNLAKSRASLTSAKSSANAVYCPVLLQAALDMQSGILHAEEKDYKTGYSYFYEAFEGYASQEDVKAIVGLKYMLLCKVMLNSVDDFVGILLTKLGSKYEKMIEVDAMKAVAKAYQNRSLKEFEAALAKYTIHLQDDPIVKGHLKELYDTLLEQNLLRIIEPYSRVQIGYVAEMINLPVFQVEQKLSQMILDKQLTGILDQSAEMLVVFDEQEVDKTYDLGLQTIKSMETLVQSLYEKARTL